MKKKLPCLLVVQFVIYLAFAWPISIINVPFMPVAHATGNVYYVDASVEVSGNGSESSPWKTMAEAEAGAADGDTVYVAAGTYIEGVEGGNEEPTPYDPPETVYTSLYVTKGITWIATGEAILTGQPFVASTMIINTGAKTFSMKGFKIVDNPSMNGIYIMNGSTDVTFADNESTASCIFDTAYFSNSTDVNITMNGCDFINSLSTISIANNPTVTFNNCSFSKSPMINISADQTNPVVFNGGTSNISGTDTVVTSAGSGLLEINNATFNVTGTVGEGENTQTIGKFMSLSSNGNVSINNTTINITGTAGMQFLTSSGSSNATINNSTITVTGVTDTDYITLTGSAKLYYK